MDDFDCKKNIIIGLNKKLPFMPNNIKKLRTISGYEGLLNYLEDVDALNDDFLDKYRLGIDDKPNRLYYYIVKATYNNLVKLYQATPYLSQKISKLIDVYKENDFCSFEIIRHEKINGDEMLVLFEDFLKFLGDDVFKMYADMSDNANIALCLKPKYDGLSYDTSCVDNSSVILCDQTNFFYFYMFLAHEIGHSYYHLLQKNNNHFEHFNIYSEVTSTLFERMFFERLKKLGLSKQCINEYIGNKHIYALNNYSASKLICNLINNHKLYNIDPFFLTYNTPYTIEELRDMVRKDCGYIMKNKVNLRLIELSYSTANIITTYFIDKMKIDFKKYWKEYKDFISMVDYYSIEEMVDKYSDDQLMIDDINRFVKSYCNR